MQVGDQILFGRPDSEDSDARVHAKVHCIGEKTVSLDLEAGMDGLEEGQRIVVFHCEASRFMQRVARISKISSGEDSDLRVTIVLMSTAVSAETRDSYRVPTMARNMKLVVNSDDCCSLLDLSSTGFGMSSKKEYMVGDMVSIELTVDRVVYSGKAILQNARTLGHRKYRYGLHCISDGQSESLCRSLAKLSQTLQQSQSQLIAGMA